MTALAAEEAAVARILAREVRRFGGAFAGYDRADLQQEARIALWRWGLQLGQQGAKSYARLAVRHRLTALLRQETRASRCPQDAWGRPQIRQIYGPSVDVLAEDTPSPEEHAVTSSVVTHLRDRLDGRDWQQLLEAIQCGEDDISDPARLADARLRAARVLDRMGYRVRRERSSSMYPQPDHRTPACHPDRDEPQGYDPDLAAPCHGCRDKFTCLPTSIARGLVRLTRKADLEVDAVIEERLSFNDAVARMKRRIAKLADGAELAPEDMPTWAMLDDADAPVPPAPVLPEVGTDDSDGPAEPAEEGGDVKKNETLPEGVKVQADGAVVQGRARIGTVRKTKHGWGWWRGSEESRSWYGTQAAAVRALLRERPPRKAAKPEKVSKKPEKKTRTPASRADRPASWPTMASGKPLPAPRKVSEEEMHLALADAQQKLGANIELEYGMEIVRRKRDGDVVATITPHGFACDLPKDLAKAAGLEVRQVFGSLSSVAMWAERRMVSGNDFFNLAMHNCTEVRDKYGRIIDRKGGVARR